MDILKYFSSVQNFGNGRFVEKLLQEILIKHSMSENIENNLDVLTVDDIPSIEDMVEKTFNNEENAVLPSDVDDEARRWTAIHEIGHALIEYLHNGETTLKRFYKNEEQKRIELRPENDDYPPIYASECLILGIAVKIIKDI